MNFRVSDLKHNLYKGLYSDQFDIKYLQLRLESCHNLPVLLIHMDEEGLEAGIDCLCEESEV